MFSKIVSSASFVLALSVYANAHTLMTPALGVQGAGARSDVQVLGKKGASCGDMDVAANIDTSTPVAAAPDGTFTVTATNFNRRRDGSRELTATADSTGTGNSFNAPVTVSQNGDPKPKELGSDQIVASLPAGMTCTGGASGNLCLVSFVNGAIQGFGNCVVVSQDAAGTAASGTSAAGTAVNGNAAAGTSATGTDATGTSATGTDTTGAGNVASGSVASTANTAGIDSTGTGAVAGNAASGSIGSTAGTQGVAGTDSTGTGAVAGNAASGSVASTANTAGTGVAGTDSTGTGAIAGNAASGSVASTAGSALPQTGASAPAAAQVQPSQAGTRAARALLAALEARGEDDLDVQIVKRALADWIWA